MEPATNARRLALLLRDERRALPWYPADRLSRRLIQHAYVAVLRGAARLSSVQLAFLPVGNASLALAVHAEQRIPGLAAMHPTHKIRNA
jgi:hypothetical protein